MINAAITPGIQPKQVNIKTIKIEPHPLSSTASGGKIIESITLQILMFNFFSTQISAFFTTYAFQLLK